MNQQDYNKKLNKIKKYDTMPYEDIVEVEIALSNAETDYTVDDLYKHVSKKMSREIFDAVINYLLDTTRLRVEDCGIIHRTWNPVGIKKARSSGLTIY